VIACDGRESELAFKARDLGQAIGCMSKGERVRFPAWVFCPACYEKGTYMQFAKLATATRFQSLPGRFAVASVALAAAMSCQTAAAQSSSTYAPGRILALPNAGMPDAVLDKLVKDNGGHRATRVGNSELRIIDLPPGLEKQMVDKLSRHPHFKFAELDEAAPTAFVPNDPYLGSQWHTTKINAPSAWDVATGSGVTIAIIDTGVDPTHPDLVNQLVPGYNTYNNNTTTGPVNGHGTWVSGAAAATINNGAGVAAVAGSAKIMPLRVVDGSGVGYWSAIASAITYAADKGARVANASFENLLSSSAIMNAAAYMKSKNGLVVVAAGNSGGNPGLTPNASVIAVSATEANDTRSSFSSYGSYVAMSAPGSSIYTTEVGGKYTQGTGTSFASPIVAGTVALMMSANPKLSNTDVEKLLYSTAVDLGTAGRDQYFGHGRVDAGAAVKAAAGAAVTSDVQAPAVAIGSPIASATVSGLVSVGASATDNIGVTKVELRVNGVLVGTDSAAPYAFSWDSTTAANGMATLQAKAYDAAGNVATSSSVSVNVSNAAKVGDVTPPVVSITSPTASTVRPKGGVTITASASDNMGTAGLKQSLYIDNQLKTTITGGSLSYTWSMNKVAYGSHAIKVVATDAAGNSSSASTTVTK
jgi:thermitase